MQVNANYDPHMASVMWRTTHKNPHSAIAHM